MDGEWIWGRGEVEETVVKYSVWEKNPFWILRNGQSSGDKRSLVCEVSQGSKDSTRPFTWIICGSGQLELKNQLLINKRPEKPLLYQENWWEKLRPYTIKRVQERLLVKMQARCSRRSQQFDNDSTMGPSLRTEVAVDWDLHRVWSQTVSSVWLLPS